MPARDPDLHHGPVLLPEDPAGVPEPHDVLAAEEFPMPALHHGESGGGAPVRRPRFRMAAGGALMVGGVLVVLRRLKRR
jgi:hypothetical protein